MKILKSSVIGLIVLFVIAAVVTATMIIKQNMIDIVINDNITSVIQNVKYRNPAKTEEVPVIAQKAGCVYACIEMISGFLGEEPQASEDDLLRQNGDKIIEPTNSGIHGELKKQFPAYDVHLRKNLKNSELLDAIYMSLSGNMPVLCLIADPKETGPHLAAVVEMDMSGDKITLNDPYGYVKTYSIREFLKAARFESNEETDLFLKLKFALEIFTKNTVFIFEEKPK
ncbi:MAG: C39 family peptidase [Oscillospiraceae bacterium]|nr:C39 family peptidase [Oscillospiraceae bacterium]